MKIIIEHGSPFDPRFKYFRCLEPGMNYQLTVNPTDTIHSVKMKIQQETSNRHVIADQRLFSGLVQIDCNGGSHILQDCGIRDGDVVHLVYNIKMCKSRLDK